MPHSVCTQTCSQSEMSAGMPPEVGFLSQPELKIHFCPFLSHLISRTRSTVEALSVLMMIRCFDVLNNVLFSGCIANLWLQ